MHKMKDKDKTKKDKTKEELLIELKRVKSQLRKLSAVVEQSNNIVFIMDTNGVIEFVNPVFEKVTGYFGGEAIGQTFRILSSGLENYAQHEEMWRTIKSGQTWRGILKNKKRNGEFFWSNGVISPLKDEKGKVTHFFSIQEDVTERNVSEDRVEYLVSHDVLTDLVNRTRFIELLNGWLSDPKNRNRTGVFFIVSMDEFKFINNTYGYSFGDEFLRLVARALESAMVDMERESIVGRLGGDEFVIFLPYGYKRGRDEHARMLVAEGIRKRLEGLRFGEVPGRSTASIGVVFYPEHGTTTKELLTRADAAMYRAKELGGNRCRLYSHEDRILEKMHSRVRLKEMIVKALAEDRFEPWFQPILNLEDNKVYHYEALTRMRDEEGKILLPMVFIESGKDLGDEEFLSFLKSKISATGADPERLVFEITETAAVHDLGRAIKFIKDLKSLGCHFALDDFGVGFSSFVYLKEMNVDYIKIEGSFIRKLHSNPNDRLFVKAMTDVAKGMEIKTIAEFVETEEPLKLLKEYGVDYAQGYHIGKPMPPQSLNAL
jgi:diguanylate cyclase (GGDEF)-like protein/PAS domain S-box-containing protein